MTIDDLRRILLDRRPPGTSMGEFLPVVRASMDAHPEWRHGQAVFNTLLVVWPELAALVTHSSLDPFYDDDQVGPLLQWLSDNWFLEVD